MTSFPGSPRLVRGGLVLLDPATGVVGRIIAFQYNPETLSRTLQIQGTGAESGDRLEALRLKGPPVETFKLDAELDATDQLEFPAQNRQAVETGILSQLAVLETIVYPDGATLQQNLDLARSGTLEIAPVEAPLVLFVWSRNRIVPVRITEFGIVEEMFDTGLNPIRAKVSLGLRVLSVDDLGPTHRGTGLYLGYQARKEHLAGIGPNPSLTTLGIQSIG